MPRLQTRGDGTLKLLRRHTRLVERLRLNQVANRFRLGQVNAPVQESAQGELAGLRRARALGKAALFEIPQNDWSAVAGNFHHVLRRIGMRRAKAGHHHLIEHPIRAYTQTASPRGSGDRDDGVFLQLGHLVIGSLKIESSGHRVIGSLKTF